MRKIAIATAAALISIAGTAQAEKKPKPTGLELQQIQSKDFEAKYDIAFPAVVSVLQDAGYRIGEADKGSGLITGTASTKSGMSWNFFGGIGKSKKTPVVSAFIEPMGQNVSRVRLNFVMAKTKSHIYGMSSSDEEMITNPVVYRDAFEKIEKAIFIRQAMDTPAPEAVTAAGAVPPSSSE